MKLELRQAFGKVLFELRQKEGLSQQALADYAEIERSYISNLENGKYYPTLQVIYKLAPILSVKPHEMIRMVDNYTKI
ncbi:MAG: helix-turn-helix transcriptional regulator [Cytophagales bacterium]|nr:helix-turn-helix transcriptional regulator [Cytophagales bacterium]